MLETNPLSVLSITSPAFILIVLGYLSVKAGWLEKSGVKALGWFLTRIALPAAIFSALSTQQFHDIIRADYLLVYSTGSLIAFIIIFYLAKHMRGKTLTESAFFGLGSSLSNTILIGYPIIIELFGTAALVPFALTLMVENVLILPLSLTLAEVGMQKNTRFTVALIQSLKTLLKNPIFMAIVAGIISSALSITLPSVATSVVNSLALTVSGLAQFTIGGILAGAAFSILNKDMALVSIGKLLVHPAAIVAMIIMLPPLDPMFMSVAVILACMPMFSVYSVLALDYELGEFCSAVLLPTTIISFITINIAIWLLAMHNNLT